MPAESAHSAGEIRRLELVFTAYTQFHYGSARSALESQSLKSKSVTAAAWNFLKSFGNLRIILWSNM